MIDISSIFRKYILLCYSFDEGGGVGLIIEFVVVQDL